ncbi:unnamed protein product [Amoebophrya sp. A120]|nr:unnamed protein product [Amoebophrya sp. A120]|eukprot:GSA120T00009847001.1
MLPNLYDQRSRAGKNKQAPPSLAQHPEKTTGRPQLQAGVSLVTGPAARPLPSQDPNKHYDALGREVAATSYLDNQDLSRFGPDRSKPATVLSLEYGNKYGNKNTNLRARPIENFQRAATAPRNAAAASSPSGRRENQNRRGPPGEEADNFWKQPMEIHNYSPGGPQQQQQQQPSELLQRKAAELNKTPNVMDKVNRRSKKSIQKNNYLYGSSPETSETEQLLPKHARKDGSPNDQKRQKMRDESGDLQGMTNRRNEVAHQAGRAGPPQQADYNQAAKELQRGNADGVSVPGRSSSNSGSFSYAKPQSGRAGDSANINPGSRKTDDAPDPSKYFGPMRTVTAVLEAKEKFTSGRAHMKRDDGYGSAYNSNRRTTENYGHDDAFSSEAFEYSRSPSKASKSTADDSPSALSASRTRKRGKRATHKSHSDAPLPVPRTTSDHVSSASEDEEALLSAMLIHAPEAMSSRGMKLQSCRNNVSRKSMVGANEDNRKSQRKEFMLKEDVLRDVVRQKNATLYSFDDAQVDNYFYAEFFWKVFWWSLIPPLFLFSWMCCCFCRKRYEGQNQYQHAKLIACPKYGIVVIYGLTAETAETAADIMANKRYTNELLLLSRSIVSAKVVHGSVVAGSTPLCFPNPEEVCSRVEITVKNLSDPLVLLGLEEPVMFCDTINNTLVNYDQTSEVLGTNKGPKAEAKAAAKAAALAKAAAAKEKALENARALGLVQTGDTGGGVMGKMGKMNKGNKKGMGKPGNLNDGSTGGTGARRPRNSAARADLNDEENNWENEERMSGFDDQEQEWTDGNYGKDDHNYDQWWDENGAVEDGPSEHVMFNSTDSAMTLAGANSGHSEAGVGSMDQQVGSGTTTAVQSGDHAAIDLMHEDTIDPDEQTQSEGPVSEGETVLQHGVDEVVTQNVVPAIDIPAQAIAIIPIEHVFSTQTNSTDAGNSADNMV